MAPPENEPEYLDPLLGIIFDLDGTLVLSHHDFPRMRKEVIRIAERHGVIPGHLEPGTPIPRLMAAAVEQLEAAKTAEGSVFRFEAEVNATIDRIELEALPKTVVRPGAVELLGALTQKGFRLALLTRSSENFARAALAQTGLLRFFPRMRTRSAPGPAKPSPEALRRLLEEMGVPGDRAVFVGDHPMDVDCAVRAGVRSYAVLDESPTPDSPSADRMKAAGATAVAQNLGDLMRFFGVAPRAAPAA
jgi:HAD superfamily hydrolase (TIGR01509 family)